MTQNNNDYHSKMRIFRNC